MTLRQRFRIWIRLFPAKPEPIWTDEDRAAHRQRMAWEALARDVATRKASYAAEDYRRRRQAMLKVTRG